MTDLDDFLEKSVNLSSGSVVAHAATSEAERTVGWPASIYWYVAAMPREMGAVAIGEWNPPLSPGVAAPDAGLCPFDTGALLNDPPHFDCGISDAAARRAYVGRHQHPIDGWHPRVRADIATAYNDFTDYLAGQAPPRPTTENDHRPTHTPPPPPPDGRPWWWEARVGKAHLDAVGEASAIYWHDEAHRRRMLADIRRRRTARPHERDALTRAADIIVRRSTVSPTRDAHHTIRSELKARAA